MSNESYGRLLTAPPASALLRPHSSEANDVTGGETMRKLAFAVAAALLIAPAALAAQVCLGYPATRGESDLGGVIRLQSGVSQFGGTYSGHYPSDLVADGLVTFDHYSQGDFKENGFSAGARLGVALRSSALPPSLSLCPHAGFGLSHVSGNNDITVPVGIGIGTTLPLDNGRRSDVRPRFAPPTAGTSLLLFATPEVAWTHFKGGSNTYVLSEIGARFVLPSFYAGASVIVASGGRNTVLGLNAGFPLPMR